MQFYVKDIMSTDVITIKENATIRDLIQIFAEHHILGVPVVDEEDKLLGVVSSSDILRNKQSHDFYQMDFLGRHSPMFIAEGEFFDCEVSSIMTNEIFSISPEDTIEEMAKVMYNNGVHRLLVVEYEKLIGVVSTFDLLKLLASTGKNPVT